MYPVMLYWLCCRYVLNLPHPPLPPLSLLPFALLSSLIPFSPIPSPPCPSPPFSLSSPCPSPFATGSGACVGTRADHECFKRAVLSRCHHVTCDGDDVTQDIAYKYVYNTTVCACVKFQLPWFQEATPCKKCSMKSPFVYLTILQHLLWLYISQYCSEQFYIVSHVLLIILFPPH